MRLLLLGSLALAGCSSGIAPSMGPRAEACAIGQSEAAVSAACVDEKKTARTAEDRDALLQAKADVLAGEVAAGRMTEAQARLELAEFKVTRIPKIEREQRHELLETASSLAHLLSDTGGAAKQWRSAMVP